MGQQAPDMQQIMAAQEQVQAAMQAAQAELAKLQKENLTLKVKADIELKKLEIETFRAETDRLNAYAALAAAHDAQNLKELQAQAEQAMDEDNQELAAQDQAHQHSMDAASLALDVHSNALSADQQEFDQDNYEPPNQGTSGGGASTQAPQ